MKKSRRKTIRRIILIVLAAILLLSAVLAAVVSLPSVIFFAIGVTGMVLMGMFAAELDQRMEQLHKITKQNQGEKKK